jgi:peroxiredoxin
LGALRELVDPLRDMGVQIVALGGDAPERLRLLEETVSPGYTLLSDVELDAAKAFGIAFRVDDDYVDRLHQLQYDLEGNSIDTEQVLPVPAVFVVDTHGRITFSYVNPVYQIRCPAGVILAAAEAVAPQE